MKEQKTKGEKGKKKERRVGRKVGKKRKMKRIRIYRIRAVARALIGGGGLNIHIFVLCPTNFF